MKILLREECPGFAQLWHMTNGSVIEWAKDFFGTNSVEFYNNYVTEENGVYFRKYTLLVNLKYKHIRMDVGGSFSTMDAE